MSEVGSSQDVVKELTNNEEASVTTQSVLEQPSRYYFYSSLAGYNLGLIGSAIALDVTKLPQPALLYICPIMIFTYLGAAFLKHETLEMLFYDEDVELKKFEVKGKKQRE